MKIMHIVGARPNFPKLAPVWRAGVAKGVEQVIVHTGQHYDDALSADFFRDLGIPHPDHNLTVGSDTHAVQTARIMERLEPVLLSNIPDWLVVYGDVNSTLAASIVAAKIGVRVVHVEAGLRSGDRTMPEEINRIVTDRLADLLLTPSRDADERLRAEGEPESEIVFVGNVMIDSLLHALQRAKDSGYRKSLGLGSDYVLVTMHRPSNVDDPAHLARIAASLRELARQRPVIFPVHLRTRAKLDAAGISLAPVRELAPIGYFEMLDLLDGAFATVTDSGGVQEESTALGVPCFTLRQNTERPVTITEGTNQLVLDPVQLPQLVARATRATGKPRRPEGWDGKAGERIIGALLERHGAAGRSF